MQNISQRQLAPARANTSRDILVVSRTFAPKEGGIEDYIYNRCLQDPDRVIVLSAHCPGDHAFDQSQPFPVHRWAAPALLGSSKFGAVLKQILYLFWSFTLSIQLYFRYRYRYIEWGHGYDFPSLLGLSYLLPVRCFMYLHGNDLLCPLNHPILQSAFTWTLQRMSGIVCNSQFTEDYLRKHIPVRIPTHVINPTVRTGKFDNDVKDSVRLRAQRQQIRHAHAIPDGAIVILSVGRLIARKGFDRVIEQLPALLADGLDVHYLLCGRGEMQAELKALAQRLEVGDRVHFAGFVPDEDLAKHYAACDIFAMLTFYDVSASSIEGFGIVYAEAGYFSKPVIASRIGGVVDAVHHEKNGLLVDPNSPDEIPLALHRLCRDQSLRKQLGRKGYEMATRRMPHRLIYSNQMR